jgi:hypothetical protein
MAVASPERLPSPVRSPRRTALAVAAAVAAVVVALVIAVFALSGVKLMGDPSALARVEVKPLGGTLEHVAAFGPGGRKVPIVVRDGRLTPLHRLKPGEHISVAVTVRRPGWIGWALGHERTEHLTLTTPVAQVSKPWMTVRYGSNVRVGFADPVAKCYGSAGTTHRVPPKDRPSRPGAVPRRWNGEGRRAAQLGDGRRCQARQLVRPPATR